VWNDPPRHVGDWYRFVRALATAMRRHRNIRSYDRGVAAVKASNPEADVLLGGMVYPDIEWVRAVCTPGGPGRLVDVIPFHAYPETWTPPGVTLESYLGAAFASDFVGAADAACGPKRIWINETGFATVDGRSELDQARWWVRAVATFFAEPRIEHVGIYEIKDLKADRDAIEGAPNYHLGITYSDRRPKLGFQTLRRLVSLFEGHRITVDDGQLSITATPPGSQIFSHLIAREDGHHLLFVWTHVADAVIDVTWSGRPSRIVEYALDGAPASADLPKVRLASLTLAADQPRVFELVP
jgi:hypothetical protein